MKKIFPLFVTAFVVIVTALFIWNQKHHLSLMNTEEIKTLKVLTYSGFLKSWGPGPDIAQEFEQKYKIKVKWLEVGNSGMILENLLNREALEKPDVVLGIDLLSLQEARAAAKWKNLKVQAAFTPELNGSLQPDFVPLDWAPLTFIFRRNELPTPQHLDDLLKNNYANALALQNPRTSSTGLYFLIWVLSLKGEDGGFDYLKKLKPSIRIISPTWSAAYSLFQNNQAPMVFSFFTSSIYHYVNEGGSLYQPVYFDDPHVYSIEYAGVLDSCEQCEAAQKFIRFLLKADVQKKIMEKNYMLPAVQGVRKNTPFDYPKTIQLIKPQKYQKFLEKKEAYLERWQKLNL